MSKKIEVKYISIDKIKPYPNNAKKHKVAWIENSISEFKFDQPIVIDDKGVIIKGHGRFEAAKRLDFKEVPVIIRDDLTPDQVMMSRLADNRTQQGGGFDFSKLGVDLEFLNKKQKLPFLESVGFTPAFLKKGSKEELITEFDNGPDAIEDKTKEYTPPVLQKRILSIVLDLDVYKVWCDYKERCGKKNDTPAFINLLNEMNSDD